jgi:hypothetical protein
LDVLAALWPTDDDPDDLDAFIQQQRASRRSAARAKSWVAMAGVLLDTTVAGLGPGLWRAHVLRHFSRR